ncbi:MAG: hypothetical protein ACMUIA_04065 [bacterium]
MKIILYWLITCKGYIWEESEKFCQISEQVQDISRYLLMFGRNPTVYEIVLFLNPIEKIIIKILPDGIVIS